MSRRLLRAVILASLAAVVCATRVFTGADWLRVKAVETPAHANNGVVTVATSSFPQLAHLPPPVAVIARIDHLPRGTHAISIAIDDRAICERRVEGDGSRRIDCAATTEWRPGGEHRVTIHGPPADWTLDYLELATHHGNTNGANHIVILPRASDAYAHPHVVWILVVWLVFAAVLIPPTPSLQRDWTRVAYGIIAGLVWLALTASFVSPWITDYRVVIAAHTFALWLALLLAPRLLTFGSDVAARVHGRSQGAEHHAGGTRLASIAALATAALVVFAGIATGSFDVAGADSYGYVSEAHLLASGTLHAEQPLMRIAEWTVPADAFVPLGYRLASDGTSIVPIYSLGYPMAMALAERIAGREAVFYVVPMLGGLAVWATFLMGRRLANDWIGLGAALLLAASPSFLFQLQTPMSDVPVTAWWALCLACVVSERRAIVLTGGLAAGAAILTRPNLAPLAAIPAALLLWPTIRARTWTGLRAQRLLLFAAGASTGIVAVAIVNARLWGSPFTSGYGSFAAQFAWSNLTPNLRRYPRWLFETETPAMLIATLGVFVLRDEDGRSPGVRAIATYWLAFGAAVFLSYLFYTPYDGWVWLRFMLPAFPPLLVLTAATLAALLKRVSHGAAATVAVVGLLFWYEASFAFNQGMIHRRDATPPNAAVGNYIERRFPDSAVFVCAYQSGSVRYYSGRLTLRWDVIAPDRFDAVLEDLRQRGHHPYLVVEPFERQEFAERFRGRSVLADLEWTPVAEHASTHVRIYDPFDRLASPSASEKTRDLIQ